MTENIKAFIEKAEQNEALKAELKTLNKKYTGAEEVSQNKEETEKKTIGIAAKYGITLTTDDFKAELSEEQLENVAGGSGGICVCMGGGWGGGLGKTGEGWCLCPLSGVGIDGEDNDCLPWCFCAFVGGGSTI